MKICILTRSENASPLILSKSLKAQLEDLGQQVELIFEIDLLNRLVSFKDSKLNFLFWLRKKLSRFLNDRRVIKKLKLADAIVISECTPNGFWKHRYNIEKLRKLTSKPIMYYEVYYLGNAPSMIDYLREANHPSFERYDAHLFISPVTEVKINLPADAFCVGLSSNSWQLKTKQKDKLIVLLDFAQAGFENHRKVQIAALEACGISYIILEKKYTVEEIRDIYREVSIYFMQSFEAFGLPILECLCAGAQVFTPNSAWPMSWRLNDDAQIHGPGELPRCFTVYENELDLYEKLIDFKNNFNPVETPKTVFNEFYAHYPSFYDGNLHELKKAIEFIQTKYLD